MINSSASESIRILPNDKVYRQLFEAQVQLSEAYTRTQANQLSKSINITSRVDGVPLIRNIRPHESQKRQWLTSRSYSNDGSINPVALLFHEERKRRQDEQNKELNELKREVFNLPDDINYVQTETESKDDLIPKGSVTERVAANRKTKFENLWKEFTDKIYEINQNVLIELENLTRQCNKYYEKGEKELKNELENLVYKHEIISLTINSFENAFNRLDEILPLRLSQIQDYCQLIEKVESERVQKVRDLFKYYSDRLYQTHHLTDKDTAYELEKRANELNTQLLENRRTYTELEARLLAGETVRSHQYRAELINYQSKWEDATWNNLKQAWILKLSQYKDDFYSTIIINCQDIGSDISTQTNLFLDHLNKLNAFMPPESTRNNAQRWYDQGYAIINIIVKKRQELLNRIKTIIQKEIDALKDEYENLHATVVQTHVYDDEKTKKVIQRDILPLYEERKLFLQDTVINRYEVAYEQVTSVMYDILSRLLAFIQPAAEQWDDHQIRLENTITQLINLMRESRRPHDILNEKKLNKLDATLDEMRCASNDTGLTRLLVSSYEQLDNIKANYVQFYDAQHAIVNKYSNMVSQEVQRYKDELLDYFHARPINKENIDKHPIDPSHQLYVTSLSKLTYDLDGYINNQSNTTQQNSTNHSNEQSRTPSSLNSNSNIPHRSKSTLDEHEQLFLTEDQTINGDSLIKHDSTIPFQDLFNLPSNIVENIVLNVCHSFLDHYDQWKEETKQRAEAVMYSKHDELNKETDLKMHLHEPRLVRIETDIYNVRIAELVMHDERIERHIRGVQETLEQMDADFSRMLNEFRKLMNGYRENISSLEKVFVDAGTSSRLSALEERLRKQRDTFMDQTRSSLRNFRKRFDDAMQYLRESNMKFRKSFKTFSEGGNFSREEIEIYRKKLEKTALQIDKAETTILQEMEKIEKSQLDESTKVMVQFQDRFQNHMTDLKFIELTNRWISEAQVKIKTEVALNNQQAQVLKTLVVLYQSKLDSIINPNLDKELSSVNEVRELYHQIVLATYERALYLKCLNNELMIPASLITILKDKGLISERRLVKDLLHVTENNEPNRSRRTSKVSVSVNSNMDDTKSVKFVSSSTSSLRRKTNSMVVISVAGAQLDDSDPIRTIRSLLHQNEQYTSDEVVEKVEAAVKEPTLRSMNLESSSMNRLSKEDRKRNSFARGSTVDETTPSSQRERPSRVKARDEIYALYCTFGEKKHAGQDFLSKILNILRDATEGLLTHGELYYRDKAQRPVTRPTALREKFDDFAHMIVEKLQIYEQQCRSFHEQSINEFRNVLELFERTASFMVKVELADGMIEPENILRQLKQEFEKTLNKYLKNADIEKEQNYHLLRPTLAEPTKKNDLINIDKKEKIRQEKIEKLIKELQTATTNNINKNAQETIEFLATNSQQLLILFDEILTADEITRTKIPLVKQSLSELVKRQQNGKPLEEVEITSLIERKQGNWPGLTLFEDQLNRRRESVTSKKRSSDSSQRRSVSASIITQKTTLPQIETIAQRDKSYQKYKELYIQLLANVEEICSTILTELDRYRLYWNASIDKLQNLREN